MKSRRRVEWSSSQRDSLEALLARANGRRTTRLFSLPEIDRCVEAALASELGFSWAHAGEAPDAREVTSVCLCAIAGEQITIGVASAHGAATPASAWPDITTWDRYRDSANAATCLAWAGRTRDDRLSVTLAAPAAASALSYEELLAAVLADPQSDAPRLVLADWLMERGDPRGELISVQCDLARGAPREAELREREVALLSAHGAQWMGPLGRDVLQVRFRRGFVESVEILDAQALPQLEGFFNSEPVTELIFASSRLIDGARFAALEWLERLRSLEFRTVRPHAPGALSEEQLAHVLGSRRLRKLSRLALVGQRVHDEGLEMLIAQGARTLPSLEALRIDRDEITAKGARALVGSKWAVRFVELSLADNELRGDGAEALAESRSPGQLARLSLGGNLLGNGGAVAIAQAPRFRTLRTLSLPKNRIGAPGLDALLASEHLRQLTSLDLSGNPLGSAGRERLRARFGN